MLIGSQQEYMDNMMVAAGMRGTVYWVDDVNGNASNDGLSAERPKKTIGQAIGVSNTNRLLTANTNKQNTIFIRGGTYAEDITTAAPSTDLVGLGRHPWYPAVDGKISVTAAAGMRFYNIHFLTDGTEPTVYLGAGCNAFEMHNCEIAMSDDETYGLHLYGRCFQVVIQDCKFTATHDYGIYIEGNCAGLQIIDNYINASVCGIYVKIGVEQDFDSLIKGNVICRSDPMSASFLATGIDMACDDRVPDIMVCSNWIAATDGISHGHTGSYWDELNCIDNHIVKSSDGTGAIETSGS